MANASIYNPLMTPGPSAMEYADQYAERDRKRLATQMLQQQNALQLQTAQRSMADDDALRATLGRFSDFSTPEAQAAVLQASPSKGAGVIKTYNDTRDSVAKAAKDKMEAAAKTHAIIKQGLGYVYQNPSLDSAMQVIGQVEQLTGADLTSYRQQVQQLRTPEEFVKWAAGHAIDADKQLQTFTTRNLGGTTDTLRQDPVTGAVTTANSARNTQSPDSAASVAVQMRGQNMTDSRAREGHALQRELAAGTAGADPGQAAFVKQYGKPEAGRRWKPDGSLEPIPGGSADPAVQGGKPLPETAQKQVVGTRNLQDAIVNYREKLAGFGATDILRPDARAKIGNAYNNMMLQAKEAYNLGVLNGPDYEILQSVVKDPTSASAAITSRSAMDAQAKELAKIAANIERTALEAHGKPYTPRTAAPTAGAVVEGFRFRGGNPADKANWEKL